MIQITCPNNNVPERLYAIGVLFGDALCINQNDIKIQFSDDCQNYEINTGGDLFIFEDHFFNHFDVPLSYLKKENIPSELLFFHGLGLELPIIYGDDKFIREDNTVIIGLDIFASTFFMLTRWEESLLGREEKGDCDESLLFCVKHGIHQRPIVNEYADLLRQLLPTGISFQTRNYEVVLSHDVDGFLTPTWPRILLDFIKQTISGAPKNTVRHLTWKDKINYKKAFPIAYGQFDLYTALTEKHNISEWFYFKVCSKGEPEATYLYDKNEIVDIINRLNTKHNNKLVLGFHPSQNVFENKEQWNREVSRIVGLLKGNPTIGRNHHLLYNQEMLRLWEQMGEKPMMISNCVFHKNMGFRSGACVPYHIFDLYQRRMMELVEYPCQIMDSAIRLHKYKSEEEMWNDIHLIANRVKHYNGILVLTWHIYVRRLDVVMDYYRLCQNTLLYACEPC